MFNRLKALLSANINSNITLKIPAEVKGNWHVNFILHLATIVKPRVYVELGLYQCELFNQMIPLSEKLIGVDFSPLAGNYMQKSYKAEFICTKTEDFAKVAKAENLKIDLLFIDANHSYESVRDDFMNFFPLVNNDGLILLHDGYPKDIQHTDNGYCGDGYRAIKELTENQNGFEMMTIPVHPGLTIARKRSAHLPWLA